MTDTARVSTSSKTSAPANAFTGMAPLVGIVFLGFLAVGAPLPALSLYAHETLGFSTIVAGWVVGLQSLATVVTRHASGSLSDARGPRRAVLIGLPLAAASGVCYLISAWVSTGASGKLGMLLIGRLLMGLGESLFMTGAMSWGIARLGAARTGKVMSWQGIAMYAALGVGAPLGLAVQAAFGFAGVALFSIAAPLAAAVIAVCLPGAPASGGQRAPFHRVVGLIWRPGLVLMLATVPFAAMATFLALDYAERGWAGAGLALAGFGAGYVAVRLVGSHLPDRFGGATVAGVSIAIETVGQAVLWMAPRPELAGLGAVLTGIGFSLVFPAMGVEATRLVKPELRGRAVGNFMAFFDVALGITGPVVGFVVSFGGYPAAFLIGMLCAIAGLCLLPTVRPMGT